jgi:O-antigen/teichoic acid export membrane protein
LAKFDLVRRAVIVAAGQSASSFGEFLAGILLVRLLAPEEWSKLALALTVYGTASGLGGLNVQDGIYYFYARVDATRRVGLALQTMAVLFASGLLIAAGLFVIGPLLQSRGNEILPLIPWIGLTVALELPTSCANQLLVSAEKPQWASVFGIVMSLAKLGLMALPLLLHMPVLAAAQGLALYAVLRLVVSAVLLPIALPKGRWSIDFSLLKEQIIYTAPLTLSIGSAVLIKYIDKWIVAAFVPDSFGTYAASALEVPFVPLIGLSMGTVLATRISYAFQHAQPQRAHAYWMAATTRVAFIVGPITVGLIICAPEAFALLFAKSYALAVIPFQIFTIIILHRVMAYGLILRAAGATKALWFASLFLLALIVVFGVPLTYFFGLPGAALAMVVAYALNLIFYLSCIARVMDTNLAHVFPWKRYGGILLAAGASSTVAFLAANLWATPVARLATKAVVFTAGYVVLVRLSGLGRNLPYVPEDEPNFLENVAAREAAPVAAPAQPAA